MEISLKEYIYSEIKKNRIIEKGNFLLKSGKNSEYYVDLRKLVSYPKLSSYITHLIEMKIKNINITSQTRICGVPYGGIYFSSILSHKTEVPLIFMRKEIKSHGTQKLIEGEYNSGDEIILIEDVITSGGSLLDAIDKLESHNLKIIKIITLFDREEGGFEKVSQKYDITSILRLSEYNNPPKSMKPLCTRLQRIIEDKGTPICLSLDINDNWEKFFNVLEAVAPYICMLKLHLDTMHNLNEDNLMKIKEIASYNNFMIWEDRKMCDIGSTNEKQLNGYLNLSKCVDFISVNPSGGDKSIKPLFGKIGIFLLSEMSSENNLMNTDYMLNVLDMAYQYPEYVSGIINQNIPKSLLKRQFLSIVPGINMKQHQDNKGQTYRSLSQLKDNLPDVLVIGRQIYNSPNPISECKDIIENYNKLFKYSI